MAILGEYENVVFFVLSILAGLVTAFWFYRRQKNLLASAETERTKQAREHLARLLESAIINKQLLTEQTINNLIAATEREFQVNLLEVTNAIALLQDVQLELQGSRHLDVGMKATYVSEVEKLISAIRQSKEKRPLRGTQHELVKMVEQASKAMKTGDQKEAEAQLGRLKEEIEKPPSVVMPYSPSHVSFLVRPAGVGVTLTLTLLGAYAAFIGTEESISGPIALVIVMSVSLLAFLVVFRRF